ncbi:MAG TPA: hypothetical protein VFG23_24935 [Polyangia bacterium]|nr:hypothetical protein [Polyangia bacterium]
MSRPVGEEKVVALVKEGGAYPSYERPTLIPVGNLNDLLAGTGTGNADPGIGANPPQCQAGTIKDDSC